LHELKCYVVVYDISKYVMLGIMV